MNALPPVSFAKVTIVSVAAEADWKKLQEFRQIYPSVKAGYLVYVARTGAKEFPIRRSRATLRFWPVPIVLEQHMNCDFQKWNAEYKTRAHYRSAKQLAKAASAG